MTPEVLFRIRRRRFSVGEFLKGRIGAFLNDFKVNNHKEQVALAIARFVENPFTNLVKGIALFLIGLSEASKTFSDDIAHKQFRVGHGLIIIGVFAILGALPQLIDGLEAGQRYLVLRGNENRAPPDPGVEPESSDQAP